MKSKKSFFKMAVFKKNISLFWPVWGTYLLFLLCSGPAALWMQFKSLQNNQGKVGKDAFTCIYNIIGTGKTIIVIFIMAAIVGMCLYNYLYHSKSSNVIHAFPITRKQLYGTNVISGLLFMWVPQLISFILSVFICVAYGVTEVKFLGIWLITAMITSFMAYAMVTFCGMFAGQLFALPLYYIVLNFLYIVVYAICAGVIALVSYAVTADSVMSKIKLSWLSPFYFMMSKIYFVQQYSYNKKNESYDWSGIAFRGSGTLALYLILAVILFIAGYFIYKYRKNENTGNLLTIGFLKPVFRWGVGACVGFAGTYFITLILASVMVGMNNIKIFIIAAVLGGLFFFIAQMLIDKSFRVFNRVRFIECGVFVLFMGLMYGLFIGVGIRMENHIPVASELKSVSVSADYDMTFSGDDIEEALDLNRMLLEQKDNYFANRSQETNMYFVRIEYNYKDGKSETRRFSFPLNDESKELSYKLNKMENDTDRLFNYIVGMPYDEISPVGLDITKYDENYEPLGDVKLESGAARDITEAVYQDIKDGNLAKYNIFFVGADTDTSYTTNLEIEYRYSDSETVSYDISNGDYLIYRLESLLNSFFGFSSDYSQNTEYLFDEDFESETYTYGYVNFGPDCKHIINVLEKYDVIDSTDDLTLPIE